jgi:signal transduction histidine kinase
VRTQRWARKGEARHRAVWLAWLVSVLAVLSGVLFLLLLILNSADPRVDTYDYWGAGAVMAIVFPVVGALIVSRYPANALGWVFCFIGFFTGAGDFASEYATYTVITEPGSLPGGVIAAWIGSFAGDVGFASMPLVPLLFPDGRPPSRRWRPVVWLAASTIAVATVSFAFMPGPLEEHPSVANPLGIEGAGAALRLLLDVFGLVFLAVLLAGVASLVVRFRRSRGAERHQIKWFAYAAVLLPASLLGNTIFPDLAWLIGGIGVACVPIAIGVAVLKYRLYDIDFLINRTLVYGALTAIVICVYVLVVGYLGALFRTGDDLLVSLLATGLVAVLFAPLRERMQRSVNRLLYGERDDPYAAVSRLGEHLEATLAPEAVLPAIVETAREALKLPYAAIALPRDGSFEVAATSGGPSSLPDDGPPHDPLVLPLSYAGETVGRLLLAPRAPGEGFSSADRRLLHGLARHAGVAVHGVRVMADLRRSREKLVLAREEERRRLRRDLHDELAPTLAALGLRAATVGEMIPTDPEGAASANEKLRAAIRATVGDVRRLVYDLRPPALDELGLVEAIRERASRYGAGDGGFRATVEAPDELPPLPAAVEVAAYRIVQEALMNVSRHARARICSIRLGCPDGRSLEIEVTDDGVGLPASPEGGVGLSSMRERAAELGGECEIGHSRRATGGTRVFARLPLAGPEGRTG